MTTREKRFDLAIIQLRDNPGACAPRETVADAILALRDLFTPRERCRHCGVEADDEGSIYHDRDCGGDLVITPRAAKAILACLNEMVRSDALARSGDPNPGETLASLNRIASQVCPGTPGAASWGRCEKLRGHGGACTHDPQEKP